MTRVPRRDTDAPHGLGAGLSIALGFGMLWVPLGQHEFLLSHWMKVGTFMAPLLLLMAFAFRGPRNLGLDPQFLGLLVLLAYIAHQFEEHWIDLYGNVFAFQASVNGLILNALGAESGPDGSPEILTRASIFVINTSLVWLVGALAIWRGGQAIAPVLAMIAIAIVNAVSHIVSAVAMGMYNPGLVTSILVFLPLCVLAYVSLWRSNQANGPQIGWSLAWSVAAHVIMVVGVIAANWWGAMSEIVYFAVLVAWSILPTAWSWQRGAAADGTA
ncbi:MAG: HXXEE domain-containing protein [Pseudomonadota bacterium]